MTSVGARVGFSVFWPCKTKHPKSQDGAGGCLEVPFALAGTAQEQGRSGVEGGTAEVLGGRNPEMLSSFLFPAASSVDRTFLSLTKVSSPPSLLLHLPALA